MMRDFMRPDRSLAGAEHGRAATLHPAARHAVVDPHMTDPGGGRLALLGGSDHPKDGIAVDY